MANTPTTITLGGRSFELKNMTAEQGAALYAALPTSLRGVDFKAQADMFAALVENFHSVVQLDLPEGITPGNALTAYYEFLISGAGSLEKGAEKLGKKLEPWIQDIHRAIKPSLAKIPGASVVGGTVSLAGVADDVLSGFTSGIMFLPRIFPAVSNAAGEVFGALGGAYSPEQAKAFGAAMAGAMAEAAQSGAGQQTKTVSEEAGFFGKINAGLEWLMNLAKRMPIVGTIIHCVQNIWQDPLEGKNWRWSRAESERLALVSTPSPSFAKLLQKEATTKVAEATQEPAFEKILAAEEIAGIKTAPIVGLANHGGFFQAPDTTRYVVKMEKGTLVREVITDPTTGKPVTAGNRATTALLSATGSLQDGVSFGEAVGGAAGVTAGGAGIYGIAEGLARQTAGGQGLAITPLSFHPFRAENWKSLTHNPVINSFRGVGRVVGDKTYSVFAGISNGAQGFVRGVGSIVTDHVPPAAVSWMEKLGSFAGRSATVGLAAAAPVSAAGSALSSLGNKDTSGAIIHGAETTAVTGMLLKGGVKMGAKRIPYVGPVMSGADFASAAVNGDTRGLVTSGTELGTIGVATWLGAGIGAFFGGVGAIPGAAIGATVGGILSIFTGWKAGSMYDEKAQTTPTPGATGAPDPGLAAASKEKYMQAKREAERAVKEAQIAIKNANTALGAVHLPDGATVSASGVGFGSVAVTESPSLPAMP